MMSLPTVASALRFQFTPLREGRLVPENVSLLREHFNSRPSARGDGCPPPQRLQAASYFNSRPSARGDDFFGDAHRRRNISIHAPPRGATLADARPQIISVFQFTPLREGRQSAAEASKRVVVFQFTPLREGRHLDAAATQWAASFQFTPLREGRRKCESLSFWLGYFNSRPSARGDFAHSR